MLVHQILQSKHSSDVFTIPPETPVSKAAETMSQMKIGALVVSSDGQVPLGILSERDIVRELGTRGAECLEDRVEEMMTRGVVGCGRDDAADAVLAQMTERRFRHMPVLENGRMIGLISIGDVVKARLSELAMERDALQDMVMGH